MTDPQPSKPELLPEERLRLENRWRKADGGMARVSRADEEELAKNANENDDERRRDRLKEAASNAKQMVVHASTLRDEFHHAQAGKQAAFYTRRIIHALEKLASISTDDR